MKPPTALEKRHMDRVANLPCLVSGKRGVTLHHVTAYADRIGRFSRSHQLIVPLAPEFHLYQHGPKSSVEALGHRGFARTYKIDLLVEAQRLWAETLELEKERTA